MWRKTREGVISNWTSSVPAVTRWICNRNSRGFRGTDPNRNFDFHWGATRESKNPCLDTYGVVQGVHLIDYISLDLVNFL